MDVDALDRGVYQDVKICHIGLHQGDERGLYSHRVMSRILRPICMQHLLALTPLRTGHGSAAAATADAVRTSALSVLHRLCRRRLRSVRRSVRAMKRR
jgi:hypothetical protein